MTDRRIIKPSGKGFLLLNSHPVGCARIVDEQWDAAKKHQRPDASTKTVLVIGSSAGYGMAAAIAAAARGMRGIGVALEAPPGRRTASAGWYRTAQMAKRAPGWDWVNGDAFTTATKEVVVEMLRELDGVDYLIYSVAAPRRTDPETGNTYHSVLRPRARPLDIKSLSFDGGVPEVHMKHLEPATPEEIEATVHVMGGEDWELWVRELARTGLLRKEFVTVAPTYVGSLLTQGIYRGGSIGEAKMHLEDTAARMNGDLLRNDRRAYTVVNGAAVTQASTGIPSIALYTSLLRAELGTRMVDPLHQAVEMWDQLTGQSMMGLDFHSRLELDGWEMAPAIQKSVTTRWEAVTTENIAELGDPAWFASQVHQLYGFDVPGVDYGAEVEVEVPWPGRLA